ncbi:MAG: hypothetical protein GY906_08035, partial [bacterium]|nr:hypothetical protein [bacterium]
PVYARLGDVRSEAVTQGKIADIMQVRGKLDDALRLLREEVLEAFERLGDVRSKAVTQGQIANILQARGELDEALRIRTEVELPVYESLGDVRSMAVTKSQIAGILQARGALDESLGIRTDLQREIDLTIMSTFCTNGLNAAIYSCKNQWRHCEELTPNAALAGIRQIQLSELGGGSLESVLTTGTRCVGFNAEFAGYWLAVTVYPPSL